MPNYSFAQLTDGLPRDIGEEITISIHYPRWILDSQRIAIERSIEDYFSSWLSRTLSDDTRAAEILGQDFGEFQTAIFRGILRDIPVGALGALLDPGIGIRIVPSFVLYEVNEGSISKKVGIALVTTWSALSQPIPSAIIGAGAGVLMTEAVLQIKDGHPEQQGQSEPVVVQQRPIDGRLVCTRQTAQAFVNRMDRILNEMERTLKESSSQGTLGKMELPKIEEHDEASAFDLCSKIAAMPPNNECKVTITVTFQYMQEAKITITQEKASRIVRETLRETVKEHARRKKRQGKVPS
jgi:hypothetical protein